jgi:hypothetical protein
MAHLVSVTSQQSAIWTDHPLESKKLKRPMLSILFGIMSKYKGCISKQVPFVGLFKKETILV